MTISDGFGEQNVIVELDISRVSLCNTGANSRADIKLTKRKEPTQMPTTDYKTFADVQKALEPAVAELVNKHISEQLAGKEAECAKVTAEVAKHLETIAAHEQTIANLRKTTEPNEPDVVLKSLPPEAVALFKAQATQLAELAAQNQARIVEDRYNCVKAIPVEEAALKAVLAAASPAVFEVLKSASAAIEQSVLKNAEGSDADGQIITDVYAQLEQKANEYAVAKSVSFETAFTAVCAQNPKLYASL